jgi:uncharacterized damage-inducible protein DinB
MNLKEIRDLYDFDRWATLRILESVAALAPDQYQKDLGSSFGGVHGTLVHIVSADRVWLNRWLGKPVTPLKPDEIPTIEVLKKQWDAYELELGNFLRTLTEEKIAAPFSYTDFKGNPNGQILWQQMQHKVNHSTYHRGQVVVMLRQLGAKAQGTDLITYYRQQESPS